MFQEGDTELPRRLPLAIAKPALCAALASALLGLALASLLIYGTLRQEATPSIGWHRLCLQLAIAALEVCLCFALTYAATRPVTRHAPKASRSREPPHIYHNAGSADVGEQCDHLSPLEDPTRVPASHARRQESELRAALLFRDRCPALTCPALGGVDRTDSETEDSESLRAQAGSTAPGTLDGSPWSCGGRSSADLSWGRPGSFRRLGSSCSSESAAHSFDLTWGRGVTPRHHRGATPRLRLDLAEQSVVPAVKVDQDMTPDSAVYVDMSPDLCTEVRSLADLDLDGCSCSSDMLTRRPWRLKSLGGSCFSLNMNGYAPLNKDDCRCENRLGTTLCMERSLKTRPQSSVVGRRERHSEWILNIPP